MPRVLTESVNGGGGVMSTPAQITICGALGKDTIAALVEIALTAGAALMVQPRAIAPSAAVVEAAPRRALPPARGARAAAPVPSVDERVHRALQDGPIRLKDLQRATKLSLYQVRQLVDSGAVVAMGATNGRR